MKKRLSNKWLITAVLLLCVVIIIYLLAVPLLVDRNALRAGLGTPLDELTDKYTPEQAATDGCLVVNGSDVIAGKDQWKLFRLKTTLHIPAAIRICTFYSTGDPWINDLTYDGREYGLHHPNRPSNYARYLKFSKATNPYGGGFEGQNKYYLSTTTDGSWDEYMSSILSSSYPMELDYKVYLLFSEWALP